MIGPDLSYNFDIRGASTPLLPRAQRVVGRGWGWGALRFQGRKLPGFRSAAAPHPRPLPAMLRMGGGEKSVHA
jgi:hypothetical protein